MRKPYKFRNHIYKNDDESLREAEKHPQSIWTFEEMITLRELYTDQLISMAEIAKQIPSKNVTQIQHKAWSMGLHRYDKVALEANQIEAARIKYAKCYSCGARHTYDEEVIYCSKCGKLLRRTTRSSPGRKKRTKDLPESIARTAAEIEAGEP
jgi:ribosomal protein L16/L10AE